MKYETLQKKKLPDSPGVYFFLGRGGKILYIGKATSLRSRVKSYFSGNLSEKRSPLIAKMVGEAVGVRFEKTDSVLEALILEANLIKKHLPRYNTDEKDDKSFNYVVITKEQYPRVLVMRGRDLASKFGTKDIKYEFGPFPHGGVFKEAMKLIRKLFPFRDKCLPAGQVGVPPGAGGSGKPCFNYQLGLCPGVCVGAVTTKEYARHIRHLALFFQGKKSALLRSLRADMREYAKSREFEKAQSAKRTLFGLTHIQDVALIKDDVRRMGASAFRIEAYDVAHISGAEMVGVMAVIEDGAAKKSDYRKFKVRSVEGSNDTASLSEMLNRRLFHDEWPKADLIVVDGGVAQRNAAFKVLSQYSVSIPVVSVVKDAHHRPRAIEGDRRFAHTHEKEILLGNSEAHRFAIRYHRDLRSRNLRG